jgi:hypothetical protein
VLGWLDLCALLCAGSEVLGRWCKGAWGTVGVPFEVAELPEREGHLRTCGAALFDTNSNYVAAGC